MSTSTYRRHSEGAQFITPASDRNMPGAFPDDMDPPESQSQTWIPSTSLFSNPGTPIFALPRPLPNRRNVSDPMYILTKRSLHSTGSPIRRPARRRGEHVPYSFASRPSASISDPDISIIGESNTLNNDRNALYPHRWTPPKSRTATQVHHEVQRRLRMKAPKGNKRGSVYIMRDPRYPTHLKIGNSQNVYQRGTKLEDDCGIEIELVYMSKPVDNCTRAEFLAQGDLWHLLRPCECMRKSRRQNAVESNGRLEERKPEVHQEWHESDIETAKHTVQRWVEFMDLHPYDAEGELKSIWKHLIEKRNRHLLLYRNLTHEPRWEHWDSVLAPPGYLDYLECWWKSARAHPIRSFLWRFSWQVSTIFSWIVTYITLQNRYAFIVLFLSIVCSWLHFSSCWSMRAARR